VEAEIMATATTRRIGIERDGHRSERLKATAGIPQQIVLLEAERPGLHVGDRGIGCRVLQDGIDPLPDEGGIFTQVHGEDTVRRAYTTHPLDG